jgi:RsiW-degrading membrane proteinase PrsW (M82 family)
VRAALAAERARKWRVLYPMSARIGTIWGVNVRTAVRLAGALTVIVLFIFWLDLGTHAFAAGLLLAILPVPVYITLALWLDRYDPEPARLLVKSFTWGAIVAVFFAMIVNEWVAFITGSEAVSAMVAAPFGEEVMKATALLLLFHFQRHDFDNVTDGVVYATMVGLGFATTENVYYYGSAFLDGQTETVFLLRGAVSPFAHPLFTSMTGIGIGLSRESSDDAVQAFAPVLGLAMAIALHAIWNTSVQANAFFPVYLATMVPAFLAVLYVVTRSQRREERILRAFLRPHVVDGTLSQRQLDDICASWSGVQIIRRWIPLLGADPDDSVRTVAIQLAFHRWRYVRERGIDTIEHRDQERTLVVRLMESARLTPSWGEESAGDADVSRSEAGEMAG